MELRLFSALGLVLSLSLSADPAPGTVAPLSAHLREVNKEWSRHSAVLINEDRMVRFDDEAQRIAAHLRLVHRTLSAMDMEQLSPTQVRWRRALLDELQAYAHRGLFPRNEVLPYRTPVFIDPYGTPCAVGRLMIASGHADLARRIDGAMETAYIQDMGLEEVAQWAVEHGFSQEELEWIQPSYASGVQWTGFAGAPTEHVRVVLKLGNGDMVVAGSFSAVGGLPATNVAVYNGLYFQQLGATGLQGTITCGLVHEGRIFIGGHFFMPGMGPSDLAIWDGEAWTFQGVGYLGMFIHALHVHEGVLYASTRGATINSILYFVSRYVNGQWQPTGWFNRPVLALGSHNGELVAGGEFTANSAGEPMAHVARFDGASWSQLGDGLDANVRALKSVAGSLHAGGDVEVDGAPTFGLARLEGDTWSALPGVQERLMAFHNGNRVIRALADLDGQPLQFRNEQVNAFLAVDPVEGTGGNEPFLGFKLVDLGRNDPPMVQDDAPLRAFPVDEVFKDDPWALKSLMKDLYFSFMYTSTRGQLRYANDRSRTVSLNVFELELLDFAHPVADQVAGKSIERKRKIDRIEEARKRIMARVEP